jgi:endonuclease G
VAIPNFYYKAVLYLHGDKSRTIGFVMPNRSSKEELTFYSIPIDRIESLTGIDLFTSLDDHLERSIEQSLCISCWSWNSKGRNTSKEEQKVQNTESVQCSGTTKAGNRCKRKTLNTNGKCYQHQ